MNLRNMREGMTERERGRNRKRERKGREKAKGKGREKAEGKRAKGREESGRKKGARERRKPYFFLGYFQGVPLVRYKISMYIYTQHKSHRISPGMSYRRSHTRDYTEKEK